MAGSSMMGEWMEASPAMGKISTQSTMHAIRTMMKRSEPVVITRPAPRERIDIAAALTNMLRNIAYKTYEESNYNAALEASKEPPEIIRADVDSTMFSMDSTALARAEAHSNLDRRSSVMNQMMGNWDEDQIAFLEPQYHFPDVQTIYGEGRSKHSLGGDYEGDTISLNFGSFSYSPEIAAVLRHETSHLMMNSLYGEMTNTHYQQRLLALVGDAYSEGLHCKRAEYLLPTTRNHVAIGKHYSGGHHIDYDNAIHPVTRYNNRLVNRNKARAARKSRKRNRGA